MAEENVRLESFTEWIADGDVNNLDLNEVVFVNTSKSFENALDTADYVVVSIIMFIVFAVGIVASFEALGRNYCGQKKDVEDGAIVPADEDDKKEEEGAGNAMSHNDATNFFLADRSMTFWFVGTSLFASNIGSEHFIGQSGDGARRGLPVAMYEWYAALLLLMLGWLFAPVYRRSGIYTTPEFLAQRFNPGCRHYLSVITCIMYVVAKLSASIYGGSLVLTVALGWDLYLSAGACILLSMLYTIFGGLRAVMYTDLFQTFIFVGGGFVVMAITLGYVGGYSGLKDRLEAQNKADFWQLWRPFTDAEYPITGMMFGQPFTSIWYWCMDQDLVQRVLSAKDDLGQKAGCTLAAVLKILPPFIMIVPGIAATTLFAFNYSNDEQSKEENFLRTDQAYPIILTRLMPAGVRGVMIASIMTAMMSSLDSVFNAGSTIVSNDIYRAIFRPNASAKELTFVGRVATVVFAVLSFLWIPIIQGSPGLYRLVVEIQGYLGPPFGIIICIAVMWPRANGPGALAGLLVGGVLGMTRMVVNVGIIGSSDGEKKAEDFGWFFEVPFLHLSIIIWVSTALVCVVVSLLTAPPGDVDKFLVQWGDVFKVHEDSGHYTARHKQFVDIAAGCVLFTTFTIWIMFI